MLRAEQNALIQEANQQLLSIRRDELEYFVQVFSDFGTQGALIAGFTVGTLTQINALDSDAHDFWKWLFWLSCAIVMVTSLHVVLTTTFINIFGPGLALRGPAGSMVRAVEGMVKEKDSIFVAFFVSVLLFQLAALACCFVVMSKNAAWTCSVIFLLGLYYWYYYCLRIYNRFKLDDVGFAWNEEEEEGPTKRGAFNRIFSSDEGVFSFGSVDKSKKPAKDGASVRDDKSDVRGGSTVVSSSTYNTRGGGGFTKKRTFVQKMMGSNRKTVNKDLVTPLAEQEEPVGDEENFMEGYLTKKGMPNGVFSDPWSRRYFVLQGSDLYYYKTKEDFDIDPKRSIKNRPISLAGYSATSFEGEDGHLQITLAPTDTENDERRTWDFRVDTAAELEAWTTAFERAGAQTPSRSNYGGSTAASSYD